MSFTYDPTLLATSPKDQLRFMLGDTDVDAPLLQDEELIFILTQYSPIKIAAIYACNRIIALLAPQVNYKIGPESVNAASRLEHFQTVLKQLKEEQAETCNIVPSIPVTHEALFDIGMNDNHSSYPGVTQWIP